jgi:hypothetical protein
MSTTQSTRPTLARATRLAATLLICSALLPSAGAAGEIEGVRFADATSIDGKLVPRRGVGLLRYRIFIKAYVAAFYALGPDPVLDPLERTPRRLEIEYFWPLSADQFAAATREGMAANLSERELIALEPRIRRMNALYEDIEPGDRYALTFSDAQTELSKNGRPLGSIEGDDFGRAMFAIWLGEAPLSPSLKTQLLADDR